MFSTLARTRYRLLAVAASTAVVAGVISAAPAAAASCLPYSPLECEKVGVTTPFSIDWTQPSSGLADSASVGTGFSAVQPNTPGTQYKADRLAVDAVAGTLKITTTQGIAYKLDADGAFNNKQDNALGVGLDAAGEGLRLSTRVVNPPNSNFTNKAEQAGLWFGPDQDNYVKLVVAAGSTGGQAKVQLVREQLGASTGVDELNSLPTTGFANPGASTWKLTLDANPVTHTVTGAYQIGSAAPVTLGSLTVPANFFDGSLLSSPPSGVTSFGGIFATQRNNTIAGGLPFTFKGFSVDPIDVTPPAAPTDLTAAAGDSQATVAWTASTSADTAGYNVYRSLTAPVPTTGTPINGNNLVTAPTFTDQGIYNGATYHYAVVAKDAAGNSSAAVGPASVTPAGAAGEPVAHLVFQTTDAPAVAGYTVDTGQGYDTTRGYGWVGTGGSTPQDMTKNTRLRTRTGVEPRSNRLIHMQYGDVTGGSPANGNLASGAWEYAVPDGTYRVTVAVGDQMGTTAYDSQHSIRVEGVTAIDKFQATAAQEDFAASVTVPVTDGRLTIDPTGGVNTKLHFVDILRLSVPDTTAPAAPTGLTATVTDGHVALHWSASPDADVAGYLVFRGGTTPVATDGTALSGATPVTGVDYTDPGVAAGATYFYAVVAVDAAGNRSPASAEAVAELPATPVCTAGQWQADYFQGTDLAGPVVGTGCDDAIAKLWLEGEAPAGKGVGDDNFSVRWTRTSTYGAGDYRLQARSDDGIRVIVDGATLIDQWSDHGADELYVAPITFTAGSHTVVVEYYERGGSALAQVDVVAVPSTVTCTPNQYRAEYFDNKTLSGTPARVTCEDSIDHLWPDGVGPTGVGDDNFSVRWTATRDLDAGTYRLQARSDDGIRVKVDGTVLIDKWSDHGADDLYAFDATLPAGEHTIVVEYYESGGSALASFAMSRVSSTVTCPAAQWQGQYFSNMALDGDPALERCDSSIDFLWPDGVGPAAGLPDDHFSSRWTRTDDLAAGTYRVSARSDDGIRVKVDGALVINAWSDHGADDLYTADVPLSAGSHTIVVEYYENGGSALAQFDVTKLSDTVTCQPGQYRAEYFDNMTFTGTPAQVACESSIDHLWREGEGPQGVGDDHFSVRWTTTATLTAGTYLFQARSDDGIRVLIDGAVRMSQFFDHGADDLYTLTTNLPAGAHTIVVEYYENTGSALARFSFASAGDSTPPPVPTNLTAAPGDNQVELAWAASAAPDLAGYRVYRSTSASVPTTGSALSGTTPITTTGFTDTTAVNGTAYFYSVVAVDGSGNASAGSATASATPQAPVSFSAKYEFQPAASAAPAGYLVDTGAPYSVAAGRGWVTEATVGAADPVPLDLTMNTRDRARAGIDPRQDSLIHMQYGMSISPNAANGILTSGAWLLAVPNGSYDVTVSVGDQGSATNGYDSKHTIRAEGVTLIDKFQAVAANEYRVVTAPVVVNDGILTIDAIGGTNTKLNYLEIATAAPDTTPPPAPAGVTALPSDASVSLSWSPGAPGDATGWYVYRSTSPVVPTTGAALNTNALTTPSYADSGLTNGTTYYYSVVAVDAAGNRSAGSAAVAVVPSATAGLNVKVNFSDELTAPPSGYVKDFGEAFGPRTGTGQGLGLSYGWLSIATSDPLSLVGNGRNRNVGTAPAGEPDLRLATLVHAQLPSTVVGVNTPGKWELAVPNGIYTVTVGVGDPSNIDSAHWVEIEDQNAIAAFVQDVTTKHASATRTVTVSDGRLTLTPVAGTNTKFEYVDVATLLGATASPRVRTSTPADLATDVPVGASVVEDLVLPNGGVDPSSLSSATVKLTKLATGAQVAANVITSGGGDVINLSPMASLEGTALYRFDVTSGVKDVSGKAFLPYSIVFTTGAGSTGGGGGVAAFTKVASGASGKMFASVVKGPDGMLYASTLDGYIHRYPIKADGTLGTPQVIDTVRTHATANGLFGAPGRSIIGLTFDPSSTAGNPKLWITDNAQFTGALNIPDFSSQLAYLDGPNLENYHWVLKNLPRSVKDHETNSIAFGPDGKIYFNQGANNAMGAPDSTWGNRAEHLLSAATLRLDTDLLPASLPLDVQTVDASGPYDPFAVGAPLTVYASGIRNAYDLVWHSNGHLYVPTNGSAAGGNTPATPASLPASCSTARMDLATAGPYTGPTVPAINNNGQAQTDFVYDVKAGKYYGHPNASRCEWVLDNGNPTAGNDPFQVNAYSVGTQPDRNYDLAGTYDAGLHASADGAIEYKGGALDGKLLVVRYSDGQDIETFDVAADGRLSNRTPGSAIPGFGGFNQPLDLAQDVSNGNIYVTQLGASNIVLLRPQGTAPAIGTTAKLLFNDVSGGAASASQNVVVRNTGTAPLTIPAGGITLAADAADAVYGANADQFQLTSPPVLPATIAAGGTLNVGVAFNPTTIGPKGALLRIASNATATPQVTTVLRGLGTKGIGGANEPSLQWILDTHQIKVDVGDTDPSDYLLGSGSAPLGEEVIAPVFTKAEDDHPVTVEPIAVFGPQGAGADPNVVRINAHAAAAPYAQLQQIFRVPNASYQTLTPVPADVTDFDPPAPFALDFVWPALGHTTYAEDARNTWEANVEARHKVRVYPLKDATGALVPNSYIVAPEDVAAPGVDYQDAVIILRNVKIAAPANSAVLDVQNLDGVAFDDRLVFNRIQTPNTSTATTQRVKDTAVLRVKNTGADPMSVTGLGVTGPFAVDPALTLPANVPAGGSIDVTVRFTATSAATSAGTLTVSSTAGTGASKIVQLAGLWQSVSEGGQEPDLRQIVQAFGWSTSIPADVNQHGAVVAVGDEVLSPFWLRADTGKPVGVRQLAGYHTFPNGATTYWTEKSGTQHTLFGMNGAYAQSLLPMISGSTTSPAAASFTPTTTPFGFKIDGEWSDDTRNSQSADQANGCVGACGHHVRFWPVKDRVGAVVAGSYLMVMDYSGINYDYQDNVYLVTNVVPAVPSAPTNVGTTVSNNRVKLTWDAGVGAAGYRVYRSTTSPVPTTGDGIGGSVPLTGTNYVDLDVTNGTSYYYTVVALSVDGDASRPSAEAVGTPLPPGTFNAKVNFQPTASATPAGYTKDIGSSFTAARGFGWVAPGTTTPVDMTLSTRDRGVNTDPRLSTLVLMQGNGGATQPNTGAWEIAVPSGTYSVTIAVGDQSFTDSTHSITVEGVPAVTGFVPTAGELFRTATVTAGVTDGRLTIRATGSNTKLTYVDISGGSTDVMAPAAPTGLTATAAAGGITLGWAGSPEPDLDGYFVYRSASATGTFSRVTGSLLAAPTFVDVTAPTGTASYYRVTAIDTSGNESAYATASATRQGTLSTVRINTGGPAQTVNGTSWSACSAVGTCGGWVTGGNAYSESDTITGVPAGMNNTIFQSEWTGGASTPVGQKIFGFAVPVTNGAYNVRLHFAELNKTTAGTRLFDVQIEGAVKLNNFDVWTQAGGIDKAIVREFPVTVTDGVVNIDFLKRVENAKVSAIEIVPAA
jgi:fibronectin type 3 domain-containing protein